MMAGQRLWTLVRVRPEEIVLVSLVLLLATFTGATRLLSSTAAYALFLDSFGAQRLPFIYIGSSIVSMLAPNR